MRKIALKTAHVVLSVAFGLVLFACPKPISVEDFLNDPAVIVIIERNKGSVNITDDSDDYDTLTAGNGRISGLATDKYYMVEEYTVDEENLESKLENVRFVSASGARTPNLVGIGKGSGAITGLINDRWYRVKYARTLAGNVKYYDQAADPPPLGTEEMEPITDGVITLEAPVDTYYMDPSPAIGTGITSYDIVKIPISPATSASDVSPVSGNIIKLEGGETTTDYVFVERDNLGDIIPGTFYTVRVDISPAPEELTVNVTLSITGDNPPVLNPASISYSQDDTGTIAINITNAADFGAAANISWFVDGTSIQTGASFTLNKGNVDYKIIGVYTITVAASKDGTPYSAAIEVTVTP